MAVKSASAPSSGDKFPWAESKGKLLVIEPLEYKQGIQTANFGEKDAVSANIYVITGAETADEHLDTLIFGAVLISQTKGQIGETICGRLGQGENKKGNPPWLLLEATTDDLNKAQAWDAARSRKPITSAAADPWASPAADEEPPF